MLKKFFALPVILLFWQISNAQPCTTTNAAGCYCNDGSNNCDLLPDITVGTHTLSVGGNNGVIEYSQSSSTNPGQLRISVETPNIGHGPLSTKTTTIYICGSDTFYGTAPATCPDGSAPKTRVNQRVYHKNGSTMTYYDRPAGTMTYHPTHGHMHYDDWGIYTLRLQVPGESNPLNWPIVGTGAKLGFCLLDYGDCSTYGDCHDSLGNVLLNGDFENFGLGGGGYNCTPDQQGITVGWADVYYQYLDGMFIQIPPGTCNGQYYIVVQIDPHNYFIEESENNNVIAMPWTLTQQNAPGNPQCTITQSSSSGGTSFCAGDIVTLTVDQAAYSYSWSNGATTRSINVTSAGPYTCTINYPCGIVTSSPVTVSFTNPSQPVTTNTSICGPGNTTLTATSNGSISWFTNSSGGSPVASGNNLILTNVQSTTTYYAENTISVNGASSYNQPNANTIGAGANFTDSTRYEIFTVLNPCILKSVKVYASGAGNRKIVLRDQNGTALQSVTANVPNGESTVTLNFNLTPGIYRLGYGNGTPNLFRNNSGVTYPYTLPGLISITGSSAGNSYYYYYYNWEIQTLPTLCTNSNRTPATVTVNSIPSPVVTGSSTICNGVSVNLNATSGFNSYIWSNGATTSVINTTTSGNYSVTVTDANNCTGTSNVLNVQSSPSPAATISVSGNTTACKNAGPTLTANSGSGYTYQWRRNSIVISGATNMSYVPNFTGNYRVVVTNALGCTNLSAIVAVTIINPPTSTISPQGSLNICATGSVVLAANSGSGLTYQWKKGTALISGATNQTYTATSTGTYKVIVTNSNGCTRLSAGVVVTGCRFEDSTSPDEENHEFSIVPNPNNGEFNILADYVDWKDDEIQVQVFNSLGQLVYNINKTFDGKSVSIQLENSVAAGMYLVKLVHNEDEISKSFIVE